MKQKISFFVIAVMLIMLYGQITVKKTSREAASEDQISLNLVSEIKDNEYSDLENVEQVIEVVKTKKLTEAQKKELYELSRMVEKEYHFSDTDQINLVEIQDEDLYDAAELELISLTQTSFLELNNGKEVELSAMDLDFIKKAQRELELEDSSVLSIKR